MRTITVQPTVLCYDDALRELVVSAMGTDELQFPWSLSFPIIQMLLCRHTFKYRLAHIRFRRHVIQVSDSGDCIALDWFLGQDSLPADAPVTLICPTLVGDGDDVAEYAVEMAKKGFRVVVLQRRGHSGLPLFSATWNLMGNPEDLQVGITAVQQLYPNAKITLIGVSAGNGIVIRYLAWKGDEAPIAGAVLICPGWDLRDTWKYMNPWISRYFALQIRRKVLWRHRKTLRSAVGYWDALFNGTTMPELYKRLYGIAGYPDYASFEAASDPVAQMHRVTKVPVVVFNNEDDYACDWRCVKTSTFEDHQNAALVSLARGGSHLGGYPSWTGPSWTAQTAANIMFALVNREAV